jgi:dTDP-4-amino-4,6-dideoxygalactose transaminase
VPLHQQPACIKEGYGAVSLPVTEQVAGDILSLPMYPELTADQIEYIAGVVREEV